MCVTDSAPVPYHRDMTCFPGGLRERTYVRIDTETFNQLDHLRQHLSKNLLCFTNVCCYFDLLRSSKSENMRARTEAEHGSRGDERSPKGKGEELTFQDRLEITCT